MRKPCRRDPFGRSDGERLDDLGQPIAEAPKRFAFVAICDAYEWPSGLTMEYAIGALEKELARENRPKGREPNSRG
jgi:hypothetical protein